MAHTQDLISDDKLGTAQVQLAKVRTSRKEHVEVPVFRKSGGYRAKGVGSQDVQRSGEERRACGDVGVQEVRWVQTGRQRIRG